MYKECLKKGIKHRNNRLLGDQIGKEMRLKFMNGPLSTAREKSVGDLEEIKSGSSIKKKQFNKVVRKMHSF